MPYIRVVGRNSCLFEAVFPVHIFRLKCCMNNSEKFFCNSAFTGEVSTPVHLERWKGTDVSLLITTYADIKCLFGGKGTNKDVFEIITEQFTKDIWTFGEATENGTCDKWNALFPNKNSQWKFSEFFCKWKTPSE